MSQERYSDERLAVDNGQLRRLLAERERESDRELAAELASLRSRVQFREQLTERLRKLTDPYELGRAMLDTVLKDLGAASALFALVTETQFLEVLACTQTVAPRYQIDLVEEAFIVGETLAIGADDAPQLNGAGGAELPPGVPLLAVPLFRREGQPLGVLVIEGAITDEGRLADLLELMAVALEDCVRYNQLEHVVTDAIQAIACAHEQRVYGTVGHAQRVTTLATTLGRALGLGPTQEKHLRLLAMVHDMTSDELLDTFKRVRHGQFTMQEWHQIVSDPVVGGFYPSPLLLFHRVAKDLRHLHCRFDGKGNVPEVKGETIPIAARIVAIAEAFDHLTGGRQGRTLSPPIAALELCRFAGTLYDPRVVEVLRREFSTIEMHVQIKAAPLVAED
ncbi:MAG TPA: HD domain-containing phosphohydrolase [Oscillatoriaceae cyanobacterium]